MLRARSNRRVALDRRIRGRQSRCPPLLAEPRPTAHEYRSVSSLLSNRDERAHYRGQIADGMGDVLKSSYIGETRH